MTVDLFPRLPIEYDRGFVDLHRLDAVSQLGASPSMLELSQI